MHKEYGLKIGNTLIGVTKNLYPPFDTTNDGDASGQPPIYTGTSFDDMMSAIEGKYSDKNLIELFSTVPEIFAPIDAWASRVALGRFYFEKVSTGEEIKENEYLDKILTQPNPLQSFQELVYEYVCYCKVTGKNFVYSSTPKSLSRVDYKNIINSYNLPSEETQPVTGNKLKLFFSKEKKDIITKYVVMKGTENEFEVDANNVLYSAALNLKWKGRKLEGYSPLLSAKKAIMNLIAVYEARHIIYVKRGALGAIISKKTDATGTVAIKPGEKKKIADDINQLYGVQKGKAPYAITSIPIDFVRFAMSIQELMPFEETLADTASIYAVLRVPRELMPKNSDSTYANQQTAEKGFIQNCIMPYGEGLCKLLTSFWALDKAGIQMKVDYSHLPALQENKKEKSEVDKINTETNRQRFCNGIITLNQWVIADGGKKVTNPLYDKLIYDMDQTQLDLVKSVFALQAKSSSNNQQTDNNGNQNNN